ncbi:hypothetical protein D1781_13305 [Amnibacterium setariae]|uniref:Uncharacterized protein n=1 Tax=Amnibacterium setariae TaxID=2306585 RepID=A0A3A1U0F4_9MICO|nr:hypothetical protein D1781_13305 [Amnibacterium setariae]
MAPRARCTKSAAAFTRPCAHEVCARTGTYGGFKSTCVACATLSLSERKSPLDSRTVIAPPLAILKREDAMLAHSLCRSLT